jgi:serine protease
MATGLPAGRTDKNQEWVLDFSNFRAALLRTRGKGITIAHPDTGWTMHPELVDATYLRGSSVNFYEPIRYANYYRLLNDPPNARDHDGLFSTAHGTGTAGVLVSPPGKTGGDPPKDTDDFKVRTDKAYVSGAAPEATVIPFRIAENPWMRDTEDAALAKCIYHCIALQKAGTDVAVMSVSLGGFRCGTEQKIKDALVAARKAGIVVIAAAGQLPELIPWDWLARKISPMFPGSADDAICVAACDSESRPLKAAFYGEKVDITAPGVNVWMSRTVWSDEAPQGEKYHVERSEGTSYAVALVAAACALWQSHHTRAVLIQKYEPHRLLNAFRYCLRRSADNHLGGWPTFERGAGVLDVNELLDVDLPEREVVDREPR